MGANTASPQGRARVGPASDDTAFASRAQETEVSPPSTRHRSCRGPHCRTDPLPPATAIWSVTSPRPPSASFLGPIQGLEACRVGPPSGSSEQSSHTISSSSSTSSKASSRWPSRFSLPRLMPHLCSTRAVSRCRAHPAERAHDPHQRDRQHDAAPTHDEGTNPARGSDRMRTPSACLAGDLGGCSLES